MELGFCLKFEGFFPGIFEIKTIRGVSYKSIGVMSTSFIAKSAEPFRDITQKKVLHIKTRICVLDLWSINITIDKGLFSSESF